MSAVKIGFIVFCLCLLIVFSVWILGQTAGDHSWQDVANVAILCFVFVAFMSMVFIVVGLEAVYNLMEHIGDTCHSKEDWNDASVWYNRCLFIQDCLLSNEWRRIELLGKIAVVDEEKEQMDSEKQSEKEAPSPVDKSRRKAENPRPRGDDVKEPRSPEVGEVGRESDRTATRLPDARTDFRVPPEVENSLLYKYAFAILFGLLAVLYATHGNTTGALVMLIVGVLLNAYWLTKGKDS